MVLRRCIYLVVILDKEEKKRLHIFVKLET